MKTITSIIIFLYQKEDTFNINRYKYYNLLKYLLRLELYAVKEISVDFTEKTVFMDSSI